MKKTILKILGVIAFFIVIAMAKLVGGLFSKVAYTAYQEKKALDYAQNNKQEIVEKVVSEIKSIQKPPKQLDNITILKNVFSTKINADTFAITYMYDLLMSPEQANLNLIDTTRQNNLLNSIIEPNCTNTKYRLFDEINGITMYHRYYVNNQEVLTLSIPNGTCKNRSLATIQFNPFPIIPVQPIQQPMQQPSKINLATEKIQAALEQEQLQKCQQAAKNVGYYFTYAKYCDVPPKRDDKSFGDEFADLGCNLNQQEFQNLAEISQLNFEKSAERADDYETFCHKEYNYWKKIDQYPN